MLLLTEVLVAVVRRPASELGMETVEAQWAEYVDKLRESGSFSSALAVADVSGSMSGTPMNVRARTLARQSHCEALMCRREPVHALTVT